MQGTWEDGIQAGASRSAARRRVLALSATGFCTFLGMHATQALLPFFEQTFHATKIEASLTVSATTVAVALLAPIVGFLGYKLGRKPVLVAGLFALVIPTLLAATADTLSALVVWRFLQGVCIAVVYVMTMTYINEEWAEGGAGAAMAAYVSGNVLGGFSGRFLTGLVTAHWGWRSAFVLLAALVATGGVATLIGLPAPRRRSLQTGTRTDWRRLRHPALLATFAVGFSLLFSLVGLFNYVTFYLAEAPFQLGTAAIGTVFAVYLVGMVVTPVAGRWIDRVGHRTMGMAALATVALGSLITLVPTLPAIVLGLAVMSTGCFIGQSAASSFLGRIAGDGKAQASGLYIACYYAGGSVGAVALGWVWQWGGWAACVMVVTLMQLMAIVLVSRAWKPAPVFVP
jgi:predicted MFS family arabinose efflux permease